MSLFSKLGNISSNRQINLLQALALENYNARAASINHLFISLRNHRMHDSITDSNYLQELFSENNRYYLKMLNQLHTKSMANSTTDAIENLLMRLNNDFTLQLESINTLRKLLSESTVTADEYKVYMDEAITKLSESLSDESIFLPREESLVQELTTGILNKQKPGSSSGGYISWVDAMKKDIVIRQESSAFVQNRLLQGVQVLGPTIRIRAEHYSSLKNIESIRSDKRVKESILDPYSYFAERGYLHSKTQSQIQKTLGISNAEARIAMDIEVFAEQVFIKISDGVVKFAVHHLLPEQIKNVDTTVERIAA